MRPTITRRTLLQNTTRAAAATAVLGSTVSPARGAAGANERIRMGWIGCGTRGHWLRKYFANFPEVEVVATCDVDSRRAGQLREEAGGKADVYGDFRKLLDRKDIDAVVIATPGHWHCLPMIHACAAGKDMYCEKPLAWSIGEGKAMIAAAKKCASIVFFGAQQRFMPHYQEARDYIASGKLGRITEVRSWNLENWAPAGFGSPPDGPPPEHLDWDFWQGPAPRVTYNPNRFAHHYWFWDTGGGWQSDWAVHMNDVTHWMMGVDHPVSAVGTGGKWAREDNTQLPDTLDVIYEYPGFIHTYSLRQGNARPFEGLWYGNAFYGTNGTLVVNREFGWKVYPDPEFIHDAARAKKMRIAEAGGPGSPTGPDTPLHQQAFLDAIRSRKQSAVSNVEIGFASSLPGHLGNISLRTGRKVYWDAPAQRIKDDEEANRFLGRDYLNGWKLEV